MNTYDPIMFDLNRDGKVDVVGGEMVEKEITIPAGEWTINTEKQGGQSTRYVLNDVNLELGAMWQTMQQQKFIPRDDGN